MNSSWKIGTPFGIRVYVHWTFVILPALAFYSGWQSGGASLGVFRLAVLLAICGCVVLHELGHALMARWFRIGTRDITLYPIGGVARLERLSTKPAEELLIAVAGPLVNVVIAAMIFLVLSLAMVSSGHHITLFSFFPGQDVTASNLVKTLLFANVGLVLFNMLPAFPMDGGRVLRALLALVTDYVRATEVAFYVGVAMAIFFGLASMLSMAMSGMNGGVPFPTLGIIAVFIVLAGRQELNMVRYRAALRNAEPIDALPAEAMTSQEEGFVAPGFSGYTWDHRLQALVKWQNGRRVGVYSVPSE
jgi:Zn-dependent protease